MRLMYIATSLKDDEIMEMLSSSQMNYIWDDESRHYKKERAIEQAVRWTKQFNKKFHTDYKWQDLYGIDEAYFDSDGYRI